MACRSVCYMMQRRLASSVAAEHPSAAELRRWRSNLFSKEQARQRSLYPRIEKIEVTMQGPGLQGTLLVMNKGISTPFSCSKHLTEWHVSSAVLALVDGEPWHLHRPLTRSCSLTLLTFKDANPQLANQAYWRSCASLLGQVLDSAFKEEYRVELLKIPEVPVTAGAFCCDLVLDPQLDSWTPSERIVSSKRSSSLVSNSMTIRPTLEESLRSLTRDAQQLIHKDLHWEPLEVTPSVALEIFSHSRYKQEEIEEMAARSPNATVSLYRCGEHVTLSEGHLVARTGLCSQYEVTALHTLVEGQWGLQRRAQGLSLPLNLTAYHAVWRKLRKRAEKLVELPSPGSNEPMVTPLSTEVARPSPQQ